MAQARGVTAPQFRYLRDPQQIAQLDCRCIVEEIVGACSAAQPIAWRCSAQFDQADHVVLVRTGEDNRHIGLLTAGSLATSREAFLLIQAVLLSPDPGAGKLLQRMVAFAALHVSRPTGRAPGVIAACVREPVSRFAMLELQRRFAGAQRFPEPDSASIDLGMAGLARRIARNAWPSARYGAGDGTFGDGVSVNAPFGDGAPSLVVLDLRAADDETIQNDARRLYRARGRALVQPLGSTQLHADARVIALPQREANRH